MTGGRLAGGVGGLRRDSRTGSWRQLTGPWLRPAAILAALAAIVGLRRAATAQGTPDGVLVGLVFGLALVCLALALGGRGERRLRAPSPTAVLLGIVGGAALVGLALVARLGGPGPSLAPAAAFAPWAIVTILVASAEELVVRGALFSSIERVGGAAAAVAVTSLAFALMHVPTYGWYVVPLDLGVGIFLGGLRLAGGGWSGPAIAHAIADLATWWL